MKYWNDLWLNEGFASFVEYFGTDYVEKDFKMVKIIISSKYLNKSASFFTSLMYLSKTCLKFFKKIQLQTLELFL